MYKYDKISHIYFILIFKLKVYKKPSKSSHIWLLRRFFVYTLIKNQYYNKLCFAAYSEYPPKNLLYLRQTNNSVQVLKQILPKVKNILNRCKSQNFMI